MGCIFEKGPFLTFPDGEVLDMGNSILDHGVPLTKKLSVRNTGDKPLIVSRIESDCACSVASFDLKTPLAPKEARDMKIQVQSVSGEKFQHRMYLWTNVKPPHFGPVVMSVSVFHD